MAFCVVLYRSLYIRFVVYTHTHHHQDMALCVLYRPLYIILIVYTHHHQDMATISPGSNKGSISGNNKATTHDTKHETREHSHAEGRKQEDLPPLPLSAHARVTRVPTLATGRLLPTNTTIIYIWGAWVFFCLPGGALVRILQPRVLFLGGHIAT